MSDIVAGSNHMGQEEEQKIDEEHFDEAADVMVVSSDGVLFKVHSYYLKAASPVFRTMLQDCSADSPELRLADDDIETALILRPLLDLVCNKPIKDFNSRSCTVILKLIRLADKWDCITVLQTLALHTSQTLQADSDAHYLFYYACALDDIDTVHRLLPVAAKHKWIGAASATPSLSAHAAGDNSALDVTTMSSFWIDLLPRKYFLALLRASRLRMADPRGSWEDVADDFKLLVKGHDVAATKR